MITRSRNSGKLLTAPDRSKNRSNAEGGWLQVGLIPKKNSHFYGPLQYLFVFSSAWYILEVDLKGVECQEWNKDLLALHKIVWFMTKKFCRKQIKQKPFFVYDLQQAVLYKLKQRHFALSRSPRVMLCHSDIRPLKFYFASIISLGICYYRKLAKLAKMMLSIEHAS